MLVATDCELSKTLDLVISRGGRLETRITDDDREFIQPWIPEIQKLGLTDEAVIAGLYLLKDQGVLKCTCTPHPYAGDEFIVTWRIEA